MGVCLRHDQGSPSVWRYAGQIQDLGQLQIIFSTGTEVPRRPSANRCSWTGLLHGRGGTPLEQRYDAFVVQSSLHKWRWPRRFRLLKVLRKIFSMHMEVLRLYPSASTHSKRLLHGRGGAPVPPFRHHGQQTSLLHARGGMPVHAALAKLSPEFSPHAWR